VYDLEADPSATAAYRENSVTVDARVADVAETDDAFPGAATIHPGDANYRERADHRTVRVVALESADRLPLVDRSRTRRAGRVEVIEFGRAFREVDPGVTE
jgi:hypothetical protein